MALVVQRSGEAVDLSSLPHLTDGDSHLECAICTELDRYDRLEMVWWKEVDAENGCSHCKLRLLAIRNIRGPKGILQGISIGHIGIRSANRDWIYIHHDDPEYENSNLVAILEIFVVAHETPNLWPVRVSRDVSLPRRATYVSIVSQWLLECLETHKNCSVAGSNLPSRVLDVGTNASPSLCLHVSKHEKAAYFALSHCWGKAVVTTTTRENLLQRQAGIDFNETPKTFQDAVTVTRDLGVRYLWIDSLCIIQDDVADWQAESGNMASIYSNAYLVIGADMSRDCHNGFLDDKNRDVGSLESAAIATIPGGDGAKCVVYVRKFGRGACWYENEPLAKRAWTLQEHILASRIIHFTKGELIWECRRSMFCECMRLNDDITNLDHVMYQMGPKCTSTFHRVLSSKPSRAQFSDLWLQVIREHCCRNITNEMDLLPCMSGIASQMQAHGAGEYLAGLWKDQLPECLLWTYNSWPMRLSPPETGERFLPYRAPTWSWASVRLRRGKYPDLGHDDTIDFRIVGNFLDCHERLESRVTVIDARCTPTGTDTFGEVSDGYIKLSGLLAPVRLCEDDDSGEMILRPLKKRYRGCPAFAKPDIELRAVALDPMYCVLLVTDKRTEIRGASGTGLILRASKQHEDCLERIGLFETRGRTVQEVLEFFGDTKETTITIV